jgi:tellurite resistance protein
MRKMASDELCGVWQRHIQEGVRNDGRRWYFGERGVGAVEVTGLVPESNGRDGAVVAVTWSGTFFSVDPAGKRTRERKSSIITTLLRLERRADARSDPGETVSSAHCGGCGAPDAGGETDACEYCGEVMNDGKRDWVLVELAQRHSKRGREMVSMTRAALVPTAAGAEPDADDAAMSRPTAHGILAWMIQTSLADGHLDKREEERLVQLTRRAKLRRQELDDLIEAGRRRELQAPAPHSTQEARQWIEEVAAVALADGQMKHGEEAVLVDLGQHGGLSAADVRMTVAKTRQRLLREARAALREEKQRKRRDRA